MALKKRYYSMNGRLIGERDKAGLTGRIDYLMDALGSVTATVDQSAQVVNTYRYKPYGGLLAKTGSGSDPKFRWVGSWGYRETSKTFSDVYVRARHYSTRVGRWSTSDPSVTLPSGAYAYAMGSPSQFIDTTGMAPCPPGDCCTPERLAAYKERIASHCQGDPEGWAYCDLANWTQK